MNDCERWPRQNQKRDEALRVVFKVRELDDKAEAFIAALPGLIDEVNKAAAGDADFRENWYAVRRSRKALQTLTRAQKHIEKAAQDVATVSGIIPARLISFEQITTHLAEVIEELAWEVARVEAVQTIPIERGRPTDAGRRAAAMAVARYFYKHGLPPSTSVEGLLAEVLTHILGQEMISEDLLRDAITCVGIFYDVWKLDQLGVPFPLVRPRPGGFSLKP